MSERVEARPTAEHDSMRTVAWILVTLSSLAALAVLSIALGVFPPDGDAGSTARHRGENLAVESTPEARAGRESSVFEGLAQAERTRPESKGEDKQRKSTRGGSPEHAADGPDATAEKSEKGDDELLRDESDAFFAVPRVIRVEIEVEEPHYTALMQDPRSYVRATVREGEQVYEEVGIHLKGAAGSYRDFHSKPALTLNFDRFREKQRFHGMDKLHLNNSVQDGSYLNELICSDLFRAMGVPSPRVSHARVTLNGRDRGLYVLKEGFDRRWLSRWFADKTGNLYDGGFLQEIDAGLERTAGEGPEDRSDLDRLDDAARHSDLAARREALEAVLDVDRFLTFLCLETITWHWDGYALKRNNYRLYFDPGARRFVFLPHGMDQMFQDPNAPILPYFSGRVARALIEVPQWREAYVKRIAKILEGPAQIEKIRERVATVQRALEPVFVELGEDSLRRWQYRAEGQLDAIEERLEHLADQLAKPITEEPVRRGGRRRGGWRRDGDWRGGEF